MKTTNFTRELVCFFGLALLFSAPAFVTLSPATPVPMQLLLLSLGSYAPTAAALIVLAVWGTPAARGAFWARLHPRRLGWFGMAWAAAAPTLVWLAAAALQNVWSAPRPPQWAGLAYLPVLLVVNLGEELGWRGYALPRLLERLSPMAASLVLGLAWGVFHLPLYWPRPIFAGLMFGLTLPLSILLTWLFVRAGHSVLVTTIFHAVFNAWAQVFLAPEGSEALVATAVALVFVLALLAGRSLLEQRFHWPSARTASQE